MQRVLGAALLLLSSCATMPHETGFLLREARVSGHAYPYSVYVPRDFDRAKSYPVILFLHGSGERGSDGLKSTQIGVAATIRHDPARVPAIVVFPQAPLETRWLAEPADAALAALDASIREFHGDTKRVYLTGLSMGGYGTIHLALQNPNRFAALVIVCGGLFKHPSTTAVERSPLIPDGVDAYAFVARALKDKPIWLFHGADDTVIPPDESRRLYAELQKAGAKDVHYTELEGVGHNAWDKAYASESPMWEWLFAR